MQKFGIKAPKKQKNQHIQVNTIIHILDAKHYKTLDATL